MIRNAGFNRRIAPNFLEVIQANQIDIVLDVGANDGGYGCELREPAVDHSTLSDHEGAMGGFRWLLVEAEVHRIKTARAQEGAAAAEEGAVVPLVMQGGATLS